MSFTIYHNPRCSKSRLALVMLEEHHIKPIVIEYLKAPLSFEELKNLRTHFELKDFVRQSESVFKTLNLSLNLENELLRAMVKEPILMQRPIVTYGEHAVIGRPVENVLTLINMFSSGSET